jgi:hypothetical protein
VWGVWQGLARPYDCLSDLLRLPLTDTSTNKLVCQRLKNSAFKSPATNQTFHFKLGNPQAVGHSYAFGVYHSPFSFC